MPDPVNTNEHKPCQPPAGAYNLLSLNAQGVWWPASPAKGYAFVGRLPNRPEWFVWTTRCHCRTDNRCGCTLPAAMMRAVHLADGENIVVQHVQALDADDTDDMDDSELQAANKKLKVREREEARLRGLLVVSEDQKTSLLNSIHRLENLLKEGLTERAELERRLMLSEKAQDGLRTDLLRTQQDRNQILNQLRNDKDKKIEELSCLLADANRELLDLRSGRNPDERLAAEIATLKKSCEEWNERFASVRREALSTREALENAHDRVTEMEEKLQNAKAETETLFNILRRATATENNDD